MIPQKRKYFVATVHYGDPSVTNRLLSSLEGSSQVPDKVVVVNNSDQQYSYPSQTVDIQIVQPKENRGYAGGLTIALGVLVAGGAVAPDIVICLNNDVLVGRDTIKKIRQWIEKNPSPALIGIKSGITNLFTGRARLVKNHLPSPTWYETIYIHGTCLIAPLKLFLDAKTLPEQFFMYWEDVAFSAAVVQVGYSLHLLDNLEISHDDKKTVTPSQTYYLVRNGAWYLEHATNPIYWRWYWRAKNYFRRLYHTTPVMKQALEDAHKGILGKSTRYE